MIRIAIADDHAIVRKGLRQIISDTNDMSVTGEAGSAAELLTLLRSHSFDVLVLDLTLGVRSGFDLLEQIKSEFPRLPVVILSMHSETFFATRALRAGALAYVQKEGAPDELLTAIRRAVAGRTYISAAMAEKMATDLARGGGQVLPHERLSDREFEIFLHLGAGRTVTDIAHVLNLSVKTISSHRTHILQKTGLRDNADIVQYVNAHQLH